MAANFLRHFHVPFAHHRILSPLSFLLLFVSFILILLVGLSLPIIRTVYLLSLQSTVATQPASSVANEIRFGVWGACATSVLDPSVINDRECYGPKLGYAVPSDLFSLVGFDPILGTILVNGLLVLLVLHPIAAGLSFLAQFFAAFLGSHPLSTISLTFAVLSAILGTIVFAADLAVVIVAKNKVAGLADFHLVVQWGNGVWMVFVGVLCTWTAVVLLSARVGMCCGVRTSLGKKSR